MSDSPEEEQLLPEGALRLVFNVARDQLSFHMAQIGALDTKLASSFGFASAIVAVASGFLALKPDGLVFPVTFLLGAALVVYVIMLLVSLVGIWPRDFSKGPDLLNIWSRLAPNRTTSTLTHLLASSLTDALSYNQDKVNLKARSATVAIALLAFEVALVIVAAVVAAIN